jgi:PBP1b-binding outer membrane lipoprotein LpoB
MKQIFFIGLLIIAVIISGCSTQTPTAPTNGQPATNPTGNTQQTNPAPSTPTKVLLTAEPYASKAYLISGDVLDKQAKIALIGFGITKTTNSDGTTTIALTSTNPEYKNQSYTLQQGQKLYFVEKSSGDDGGNQDQFLPDDNAVIVDADGYVVS